jgi:hypothetical protein
MIFLTTQSRYIKTDIIIPVGRDESINYFDPDVDTLAGEDIHVFHKLSQDAKCINTTIAMFNPHLPKNHRKLGPWIPSK